MRLWRDHKQGLPGAGIPRLSSTLPWAISAKISTLTVQPQGRYTQLGFLLTERPGPAPSIRIQTRSRTRAPGSNVQIQAAAQVRPRLHHELRYDQHIVPELDHQTATSRAVGGARIPAHR